MRSIKAAFFLLMAIGLTLAEVASVQGQSSKTSKKKAQKLKLPTLPVQSLRSFVAGVKANLPRADEGGFIEPSARERRIFHNAVRAVLQGNLKTARTLANSVNYDLARLKDAALDRIYVVLVERTNGFRGQGTYVFDLAYRRNLVLEAPHPLFDINTPEESTTIFQKTGARAMFIAGTHRCANEQPSPCSGTTGACGTDGEPFKISDAAHFTRNFFQEAHRATLSPARKPVAVSVHGNGDARLPDVVLSNGTDTKVAANALVNRLRRELKIRGVSVKSCNFSGDGDLALCGTTNVQGRLSNGSSNSCQADAQTASGFFIHLEQHRNIRDDPTRLIAALKAVIPLKR